MADKKPPFRTGDAIRCKVSDEVYVCAWADPKSGYLSWLGWPPGEAKISGFELAEAASDEAHRAFVRDLKASSRSSDAERAVRLYGDPDAEGGATAVAQAPDLIFPRELTPEVKDVLSIMCFQAGPIAHAFRDAGRADIKRRAEDEQAFVLHWLLTLALEHGPEWRKHADDILDPVIAEAEANRTAREEAAKAGGARG